MLTIKRDYNFSNITRVIGIKCINYNKLLGHGLKDKNLSAMNPFY